MKSKRGVCSPLEPLGVRAKPQRVKAAVSCKIPLQVSRGLCVWQPEALTSGPGDQHSGTVRDGREADRLATQNNAGHLSEGSHDWQARRMPAVQLNQAFYEMNVALDPSVELKDRIWICSHNREISHRHRQGFADFARICTALLQHCPPPRKQTFFRCSQNFLYMCQHFIAISRIDHQSKFFTCQDCRLLCQDCMQLQLKRQRHCGSYIILESFRKPITSAEAPEHGTSSTTGIKMSRHQHSD